MWWMVGTAFGGGTCLMSGGGSAHPSVANGEITVTFTKGIGHQVVLFDGNSTPVGSGSGTTMVAVAVPVGAERVHVKASDDSGHRCDWIYDGKHLTSVVMAEAGKVAGYVPQLLPCKVDGGTATITYVPGATALADEQRHATAELREPKPTPTNGYLRIDLQMGSVDLGDASIWILVAQRPDGTEVARLDLTPNPLGVPRPPGPGQFWWINTLHLDLPDDAPPPVHVRLANRATAHTCDWDVVGQ